MAVKITKKLTYGDVIKDIKREAKKESRLIDRVVNVIRRWIRSGKSPVKGKGKFEKYSKAYKKRKGQTKVDMRLSEKMLNSLEMNPARRSGDFTIVFKDSKIAEYHNSGTAKGGKTRRLLPTKSNEKFENKLMENITNVFFGALRKAIKKQNR